MRQSLYYLTVVVLLVGYWMMPGRASSHREAPLISGDPQADTTDVYAFVSPDAPDTVTLISSWIPFEDPQGGPNFYRFGDNVLYEFKIDNNGDGVEDITYQFRFTSQVRNPNTFLYNTGPIKALDDPNRNMYQTYTRDAGRERPHRAHRRADADDVRQRRPGVDAELRRQRQRHLRVHGRPTAAAAASSPVRPTMRSSSTCACSICSTARNLSEAGVDSLAGFNVHSIALQVPKASLRAGEPDHRRVGDGEPSGDDDAHGRIGNLDAATSSRCRASACRSSTKS